MWISRELFFLAFAISCCSGNVIIIGAGSSGIAAATWFLDHGYSDLVLLEAENRIGGRLNTVPFGENVVDLGAQWCHGEENNAVFQLANPLGLLQHSLYAMNTTPEYIDESGRKIPEEVAARVFGMLDGISQETDGLAASEVSLGEYVMTKFNKRRGTELKDVDGKVIDMIVNWYENFMDSLTGAASWFDVSAKGVTEYWNCPGDHLLNWKGRGYKTILDVLMKKIPGTSDPLPVEEKTLFNKTVKNIAWNDATNVVTIECEDGSKYTADQVIVTVSLGVLKERAHNLFTPKLPKIKTKAIDGLGMGLFSKIMLEFSEPWWEESTFGYSLGWSPDQENTRTSLATASSDWWRDLFGFYRVEHQPNVLFGMIVGTGAHQMEMLPTKEVRAKCVEILKQFFGKEFNVTEPVNIVRSSWSVNPHFRGSYSFRSMHTEETHTAAAQLAKPLRNLNDRNVVFFAGEATHDHYFSTVHGAIESGWREARQILDIVNSRT